MTTTQGPPPALRLIEVAPLGFTFLAGAVLLIPGLDHLEIVGIMASVLVFVPAAVRVWRARNDHHALLGVSVPSNVFIINNSLIWGIYAYLMGEFRVGAAGIVNLPLAAMIVAIVVRSRIIQRRQGRTVDLDEPEPAPEPPAPRRTKSPLTPEQRKVIA